VIKIVDILKDPNLLQRIIDAAHIVGIVGEELPIKAVTLVVCSKLVNNKAPTSSNLHPEDTTSVGKDWLIEQMSKILFSEDWIEFDSPTPKAISYSQRRVQNEDGTWRTEGPTITKNSIIYISDGSEELINGDDFKLLTGKANVNIVKTILQHSVRLRWGKPVVIVTTADTTTGNQLNRRLPSLPMDSTTKQTKAINKQQMNIASSEQIVDVLNNDLVKSIINNLPKLEIIHVSTAKIVKEIENNLPECDETIMRTLLPRLLDYIKFSCALHQKQRVKQSGYNIYYATSQDLKYALEIFKYIYSYDLVDVSFMNKRQKNIRKRLIRESSTQFTVLQMMAWKEAGGVRKQTLYIDLNIIRQHDGNILVNEETKPTKYYYSKVVDILDISADDDKYPT